MRKITLALAILGTTLVPALYTAPAHAQATRTWVSGVGDDANPCSRTAPCKTFAGAISKTANGGEINCLDPGGFGALTITKSITIICGESGEAGVLVSGTPGITVAAQPGDRVVLRGLDLQGLGTGTNGINFISGLELIIDKCNIQAFATNGVNVNTSTANARVIIKETFILGNGTNGTANTGGVTVTQNGGAIVVQILNSVLEQNQNYGVQTSGASATVALANSFIFPSLNIVSGQVVSVGPSNIIGGGTNPTSTPPFK
jgi:hypothetical protein